MGKTAFVFAGQGSQSVGMGKDLYENYESVKNLIDFADNRHPGIKELMFQGPKDKLDITINTQPAVFLVDLACVMVLTDKGIKADGAAGFSLGEIPAVCYAGLMEQLQAFDFVNKRAKLMQECSEKNMGCMFAVVKLPASEVEDICRNLGQVYPVNYNCPGQTVVACSFDTADELQKSVTQAGGKSIKLSVNGAFHSPFMNDASLKISQYLEMETFGKMRIPVYANVTAEIYDDPKVLLAKQVNHPVLWQKTVENMKRDGFDTFVEVGPGKTLTGLINKIDADIRTYNVCDVQSLENTEGLLKNVRCQ